jgi:uncharacterized protein (DUF1501 family)
MAITRRVFMKGGAMAMVGTAVLPAFLTRAVYGSTAVTGGHKRLVVIFQRGAADGLNIVVPHGEPNYYQMRPTINIPRTGQNGVIDLDGFFGLHPSMSAFKPLWEQKHLAIVHAAGSPDTTRSHFDAQDYMESGTPGLKSTEDGWLNRAVRIKDEKPSPFLSGRRCRASCWAPSLPLPSTTSINSASEETIPTSRRSPARSKRCTTSRSTPSCTAPARKHSKR